MQLILMNDPITFWSFLFLGIGAGFLVACAVGANDVSNAMGTSVGAKVLTVRQAILVAAVFEFLGCLFASGPVLQTLTNGLMTQNPTFFSEKIFMLGMLSSLLAAGTWLSVASIYGWPVSTTHSIVGALVGFTCVGLSPRYINWSMVAWIGLSWLFTPVLGLIAAYGIFTSIQLLCVQHSEPRLAVKYYFPVYVFLTTAVIGITLSTAVLAFWEPQAAAWKFFGGVLLLAGFTAGAVAYWLRQDRQKTWLKQHNVLESAFSALMVSTACAMAFAHGGNDVSNAVGPLAAILQILLDGGIHSRLSWWTPTLLLFGGVGMVLGLMTYGQRVMQTIGSGITALSPIKGFSAELSTAGIVLLASAWGLPVSTTHVLVGSLLGVGLAQNRNALDWSAIRSIFATWCVTLPAGALFSCLYFGLLKVILL